ncbi:hypothetical protein BGZ73_008346 [Actinomortierella ambigua]|nr:hypothetical protein BGZ73_008346 [Actinomortierella ambigua]
MSFFGSTQGQGAGSSGSGQSNSNSNSAASWGSFLKQGLSQIESKLDKVLDMQVPIPSGNALSAFSPHSMSTLLSSPEGIQGGGGGGEKTSSGAMRASTDSRRSNLEGSTRPSNDRLHGGQQESQETGSADAEEASRRSASPRASFGLSTTVASARQSQDLRKSTSISNLRQAAQQHTGAGGDEAGRVSTSGDAGSRGRNSPASVEVDPITGMVTAAPALRMMNPSPSASPPPSTSTSPASSSAAAAAAAAAASRERLENRMRGIFKKPAATTPPGSSSGSAAVRSSTEGQSSTLSASTTSPSTSATPTRTQSPAPVSTPPPKEPQSTKDQPKQRLLSKTASSDSVTDTEGSEGDHINNDTTNSADNDNTSKAVTEDVVPEIKEDELTVSDIVEKETSETSGKDAEVSKNGEDDSPEPSSPVAAASSPQTEVVDEEDKLPETLADAEKSPQDVADKDENAEEVHETEDASTAAIDAVSAEQHAHQDSELLQEKGQDGQEAVHDIASVEAESVPSPEVAMPGDVEEAEGEAESVSVDGESLSAATVEPTSDTLNSKSAGEEEETGDKPSSEEKKSSTESSSDHQPTSVAAAEATGAASAATSKDVHPAEAHLVKVVEQREEQLFKVMQEHSQLIERHRDLEDAKEAEQQLLNAKIAGLEGIIEQQKKELDMARSAAATNAGTPKSVQRTLDEQKRLLEEKDEQIRGLLAEGEVLSKKEFKNLTTIKTLRAKNIEVEKVQQDLQQKLDKTQASYTESQTKINRMTEEIRQLNDTIRSLTEQNNRQNKQISKLESDMNQMREDKANLQLGLDRAWQELEEARKASDEMSAQAQQAAVEHERKVNEELQEELALVRQENTQLVAQLRQEIQDLRVSLSNRDEAAGELEDQLRAEIQGLQWRLEQTDGDAYEMQEAIEEARRPLQRQLESLQAQNYASTRNWERIEKQLTSRVRDAEDDLLKAQNREKLAKEKLDAMKTQMVGFEARLDTLRSADTQLRTELSATKRQCLEKDEALKMAQAELTKEHLLRERAVEEAKEDESRRSKLAVQEEMEKLRAKVKQLQQQLSAKEELLQQQQQQLQQSFGQHPLQRRESSSSINTMNGGGSGGVQGYAPERTSFDSTAGSIEGVALSRSSSVMGVMASSRILPSSPPPMASPSLMGLGGASGSGGPAVAIERLSSMVRHLEGQVAFLNEQVRTSNKHKDDLSEELVKVSMELESLQGAATRLPALEQELAQLQGRHAAALELLGEKTEAVQELKADLADVKDAYRDQLNELLGQLEVYRKSAAA